ncbi:MAG: phenylalanine--tRNA ligase subunit alpha [Patescibacteria group bacterium]
MNDIKDLKKRALSEIKEADEINKLKELQKKYIGKNGEVSDIFRTLSDLPKEKRSKVGKAANELKKTLEEKFNKKLNSLEKKKKKIKIKSFDATLPGKRPKLGHLHPITIARQELSEIFKGMGFSVIQGPDVETVWYNFDALNIPKDHPAREMQDTLFVKTDGEEKKVMRTHTSPVQIRHMEENQPPIKVVVPGRVYRNETTDASHEINFYQMEGLMIDKDISVANFKAIITQFIDEYFKGDVEVRLRPSYFPFTEPSFEVDMSCTVCNGEGCSVCSQTGWVEVLGAGMVHPNVIKNSGLNPKHWQGFAFGMGIDRLAMIKYGIDDVRLFYSGDLRFLNQF